MMNMHEQLLAQRARLVYALGSTTRVVEFEDRRIEKFSPDELLTAIAGIDQQISAMSGQNESRVFTVASSSGLTGNGHCCGGGDVRDDRYEAWVAITNYVQGGIVIRAIAPADVASGDLVKVGNIVGVAACDASPVMSAS